MLFQTEIIKITLKEVIKLTLLGSDSATNLGVNK